MAWSISRRLSGLTRVGLCLALAAGGPAAAREADEPAPQEEPAAAPAVTSAPLVRLPYGSAQRAREFVAAGVLRLVVPGGYAVDSAEEGEVPWKTVDLPAAEVWRFRKPFAEGSLRTLELLLAPYPAGGFGLYLYGATVGDGEAANPELAALAAGFGELLEELGREPLGGPHDRYLVYPLSYVQADRAAAVLRTLGYAVVEYTAEEVKDGQELITPDRIFAQTPAGGSVRRPVIINLIDSDATSLVTETLTMGETASGPNSSLKGGQRLAGITDAVPQQRLLIVWDEYDTDGLDRLLVHIQREIDVPARQILIEALVIEVNRDRLRELGVDLSGSKDGVSFSFSDAAGKVDPSVTYIRPSMNTTFNFLATLRALESEGEATVLSRPSVLVLDGRQARIKVAEEIPFSASISFNDSGMVLQETGFLTAGIILNLRPRASFDNSEVSMQVETIISSAGPSRMEQGTGVLIAPTINSRQVQTLVRVANDTPFVIGGLISLRDQDQRSGVPWLSRIPGLGALFRKKSVTRDRQEVIVVITPHVVTEDDPTFSYTVARDADLFDTFGADLFRNVYRIRSGDVFDLAFIKQDENHRERVGEVRALAGHLIGSDYGELPAVDRSRLVAELGRRAAARIASLPGLDDLSRAVFQDFFASGLLAGQLDSFLTLFDDGVPGEEMLVHRMMLQILERQRFDDLVPPDRMIFFRSGEDQGAGVRSLDVQRLVDLEECPAGQTRVLAFQGTSRRLVDEPAAAGDDQDPAGGSPPEGEEKAPKTDDEGYFFSPPVADTWCESVPSDRYHGRLRQLYLDGTPAILLNDSFEGRRRRGDAEPQRPLQLLQSVLALERLLDLNDPGTFPRRLDAFHVGRELVFPTVQDLDTRSHLIDLEVAERFYETLDYYAAFQRRYAQEAEAVDLLIQPVLELFEKLSTSDAAATPD